MIMTPSQQRKWPPRRHAFRLLCGAGPLVAACLLYTSAWSASTVYVAQSGNDQNNGATPQTAVKSVARGLALAAAGTEVQIAAGLYDEQLPPIPQGVALSGGWDPSFDPTKRTLLTGESLRTLNSVYGECVGKGTTCAQATCEGAGLTCLTNSNGDRVVTLRSPGGQALRQLVVLGPDLSSKNDGSSSFGVIVDSASGARLDYVSIEAGNGAAGVAGANKLPPTGTCVSGGAGGVGGHLIGSTSATPNCGLSPPAGAGGSITVNGPGTGTPVVVAEGGAGGAAGATNCMNEITDYNNLSNGQRGGNGQDGVQGLAGAAAPTDPGQFTDDPPGGDLIWIGNHGGRGGDGSAGAGGGGGAAGDTADIEFACLMILGGPTCCISILGGDGHQGGAGGCGGGGGGGGSSGGGAFALVVADTPVGSAGLVLFGGAGGEGGGGGSSADGTLGVHDDTWGSGGQSTGVVCSAGPIIAGTGGQGGYGGKGGGGGGGAGGNGGPSIQLVHLADGALTMDANATLRYAGGRAGTGGSGGTGVQKNAAAPGNGGSSAQQMSIPLIYVSASASSGIEGAPPADAVDGNPNTAWNSGGYAPAWIELDLKQTVTLAKVHLLVGQSPAGPTTHQLFFGPSPAPTALIATLSGSTTDMQWLDVDVSDSKPTGRYLRVATTVSPSWVAWREIVVQTQ
jgi:F5/8 type C domain